ncbi:Protein CBG01315 [Caenorhabditis briggsae]|uniref:Ubiquitin carboxyl-terminal hydrolase 36 n=1 Tax=Caenorhabditis briggsae TaxID=6238 RepID=A8WQ44_CAEBR|nr:Protein CBG01315 [Caenorhabditis briggsae]CAP22602.1 Protein CBG01315 [Caenorhabditis briggsae]
MTVNNEGWGAFKTNKWLFTTPSSSGGRPQTPVSNSRVTDGENSLETPVKRANRPRTLSDRGNEILDNHEAVRSLYAWTWNELKENYPEKGINNPSVFCYAISCIQLLSHVPAVVRFLQEHRCQDHLCLACCWRRYFFHAQGKSAPIGWFPDAFKKDRKFNAGLQEDAHDALLEILAKLDKAAAKNPPPLKNRKLSDDLFGYSIRNEVQCKRCQYKHVYYENNTVMTVRMMRKDPSGHRHSIKDLMRNLFNPSVISGYICTKCKNKNYEAPVKPTLLRAPQVLLLHISRFSYDKEARKISRPVTLNETLDVSSMATASQSTVYKFCGAIIHAGHQLDFGHYWCVTRSRRKENSLITLNDSQVFQHASLHDLPQSYIVMYRRKEHLPTENQPQPTAPNNDRSMI